MLGAVGTHISPASALHSSKYLVEVRHDVVLFGFRGSASLVAANSDNLNTSASSTGSGKLVSGSRQSQANSSNERGATVYVLLLDARVASLSASSLVTAVALAE